MQWPWHAKIELPYPVWSKRAVLGSEFAAVIGGHRCHIFLPRGRRRAPWLLPPKDVATWPSHRRPARGQWGDALTPHSDLDAVGIRLIALRFDDLPDSGEGYDESPVFWDAINGAYQASAEWRVRLVAWLAVLHGATPGNIPLAGPLEWVDVPLDSAWQDGYWPSHLVDTGTWLHAIHHASKRDDAPIPYVYLRRAEQLLHEGDYRGCVIEAAVVWEWVIEAALVSTSSTSTSISKATPGRSAPISRKVRHARKIGMQLPAHLPNALKLRNGAVHQARRATASRRGDGHCCCQ
jgi:hypothetical protein